MSATVFFKKGAKYTRKEIGWILLPEAGRPSGGDWDTGYVRVGNRLIVFMNIGVPGRTQHDFDNDFDESSSLITWFGKAGTNSKQPTFQKLLRGELEPHFFARWDNQDPQFVYLGTGKIVRLEDGARTRSGIAALKVTLSVLDAGYILPSPTVGPEQASFMFERHLEDFLINNWERTKFANSYNIYEEDGIRVGRQFRTDTGPLDILALSKDGSEFLVLELKKGRASDEVVTQTLRYMGWVQENLCNSSQSVRGCIVALSGDARLENALKMIEKIEFLRYEIDFRLVEGFHS